MSLRQPEEIEAERDYDYRGVRTAEDEGPQDSMYDWCTRKEKLRSRRARKGYKSGYAD